MRGCFGKLIRLGDAAERRRMRGGFGEMVRPDDAAERKVKARYGLWPSEVRVRPTGRRGEGGEGGTGL